MISPLAKHWGKYNLTIKTLLRNKLTFTDQNKGFLLCLLSRKTMAEVVNRFAFLLIVQKDKDMPR